MRYAAFLRGINVGGNTKIDMAELRDLFESLGFENVKSYINSGNLAFDTKKTAERTLVSRIESAIEKDFGKKILVMIRDQAAINTILENNPFDGVFGSHKEMHVLFMKDEMLPEQQERLLGAQTIEERFSICGREIYCHLRTGTADSLLGKGFIDKKLKVTFTARNWRTVQKLAEL